MVAAKLQLRAMSHREVARGATELSTWSVPPET